MTSDIRALLLVRRGWTFGTRRWPAADDLVVDSKLTKDFESTRSLGGGQVARDRQLRSPPSLRMYGNGVSGRAARVDARPGHRPSSAAQRGAKFGFPQFGSHEVSYVGYIQHPTAVDYWELSARRLTTRRLGLPAVHRCRPSGKRQASQSVRPRS
jgi:hypothetical protein